MPNPFYPYGFRGDGYFDRRPIYSGLLSEPTFNETDAVEPVDLATAKRHLRITFTDDDNLLNDIIKAARVKVEHKHNKSLVRREVTVYLSNGRSVELPYGPVVDTINDVTDIDGSMVDFTIGGLEYPTITYPISTHLKIVYMAGYTPTTIPANYKREILEEIAYMYRHPGDEKRENGSSKSWIV
jgi:hypothetical protein